MVEKRRNKENSMGKKKNLGELGSERRDDLVYAKRETNQGRGCSLGIT